MLGRGGVHPIAYLLHPSCVVGERVELLVASGNQVAIAESLCEMLLEFRQDHLDFLNPGLSRGRVQKLCLHLRLGDASYNSFGICAAACIIYR
jgi:hypothetical protein